MYGEVKQLKQMIKDMNRGIHTCIPGKITNVNSSDNTIDIQPAGKYKKPDGTYIDYPELKGVPIVQMQGSGQKATIQFPIKKDDGVMVFFSEQQLDQWRDGEDPKTDLRHDLTSAIAIPGLCPDPNNVHTDSCDNDAIIIQYGDDTKITANEDTVEIKQKDTTIVLEGGKVKIKAPSDVEIEGNVKIKGDVSVTGDINATGDIVAGIISLLSHAHTCTAPGSPTIGTIPQSVEAGS